VFAEVSHAGGGAVVFVDEGDGAAEGAFDPVEVVGGGEDLDGDVVTGVVGHVSGLVVGGVVGLVWRTSRRDGMGWLSLLLLSFSRLFWLSLSWVLSLSRF